MNKMKQKTENIQKCEFVLTLGKNIVCQRYFTVRDFNYSAAHSLDLHYYITNLKDELEEELKRKTLFLLDSNYRNNNIDTNTEEDYFALTIKKGNQVVYTRIFLAKVYPPKVRFTVDIRPKMTTILGELTNLLSDKKVTTYYQDYSLINN